MNPERQVINLEGKDFLYINGGVEYDHALIILNDLTRIVKKGSEITYHFTNNENDEVFQLSTSDISTTPQNEIIKVLQYGGVC